MDEGLEYDAIVQNHWKFLYKDWPIIDRMKHHRTEIAAVNDIDSIKTFVLNVEKGVMLLYVLVKGVSLSDMAQCGRASVRELLLSNPQDAWNCTDCGREGLQ
jgi:hypothetical protein